MPTLHCAAVLGALTALTCGAANAADKIPPVGEWTVSGHFEGKKAQENLSGAACTTKAPPFNWCLIVNDEENYAQFFSISGTTIEPGKLIQLRAKDSAGDPDGEGAAYDEGFFYVTGSHGRARNNPNKSSVPSYVVFRIPVDKATGKPAETVEPSTRLHDVIHDSKDLGPYFNAFLDPNGANIEGIAVKGGRMYVGFRGPSVDGNAFILSVDASKVFSEEKHADLGAKVQNVKLGKDAGIRDMAAVEGGILLLSGPVTKQDVTPAIFFWNEQTGDLRPLAELEIPQDLKEHKAETLLVLRDEKDKPFRALVMFDGPPNGRPTEYEVPR